MSVYVCVTCRKEFESLTMEDVCYDCSYEYGNLSNKEEER